MHFSLLDILRVISGIVLFNSILSWWFTSSTSWGYDGKYIDPRFYIHLASRELVLTPSELAIYNGSDPLLPIYVAINGTVYDVSRSRRVYGPKGSYRKLSGRDCARVYVTGCFYKEDEYTHDLRGLDEGEAARDIAMWQKFMERKYWVVGRVLNEEVGGEVPSECEHVKGPF